MRSCGRLRVGVSACLLGEAVRWDGGHKRDPFLTDLLGPFVEWVPVCPEVELGLGIPREPIHLAGDPAAPRLVAPRSGADHTAAMRRYVRARIAALARAGLVGYVLKKDSPSCGMTRVRVHRDDGRVERTGVGMFARELLAALPLLPVEEDGRLHDPRLRENFVERLFAYARWRAFRDARPTRGGLVAFHARHKYQLLVHSPSAHRALGRLVATVKQRPLGATLDAYGAGFMRALTTLATPGRHANVLEHMLGYVSDALSPPERQELLEHITDHRRGLVPLVVPLTLLRHHVRRLGLAYLAEQTYLEPHPKELMLRNHV
jgi:uncharacterized protein YbgA (DUF1722 family)/uncharacterized protein YbbK (DUF523 family)